MVNYLKFAFFAVIYAAAGISKIGDDIYVIFFRRRPLTKQDNQSKEHVIPIQIEAEVPRKISSPLPSLPSWSSKSSIPRTSSSR